MWLGGIALVIIIVSVMVASALGGATVLITPKTEEDSINTEVTATSSGSDTLGYELLTLEAEGERRVSVSGSEEVSEQATGTITIYNAYSTTQQRLIKNTRFESPNGLIFRVLESVVVPGSTKDAKGNTVPGSTTAQVFADDAGETYNIGPSKFTIPGLKGTDQYDRMYAESKSSFSGGFEGEQYLIDDAELADAQSSLHTELREALMVRLENERPAGFELFDEAVTYVYESLPGADGGGGEAIIKERAKLVAPLFKAEDLASHVAKVTVQDYTSENVLLESIDDLAFTYSEETKSLEDITTTDTITFTLEGKAKLIWQFNEENLTKDLLGLSKPLLLGVLSEYPAILKAEAKIHPFWKKSFPKDAEDISFEVVVPN